MRQMFQPWQFLALIKNVLNCKRLTKKVLDFKVQSSFRAQFLDEVRLLAHRAWFGFIGTSRVLGSYEFIGLRRC